MVLSPLAVSSERMRARKFEVIDCMGLDAEVSPFMLSRDSASDGCVCICGRLRADILVLLDEPTSGLIFKE